MRYKALRRQILELTKMLEEKDVQIAKLKLEQRELQNYGRHLDIIVESYKKDINLIKSQGFHETQ